MSYRVLRIIILVILLIGAVLMMLRHPHLTAVPLLLAALPKRPGGPLPLK